MKRQIGLKQLNEKARVVSSAFQRTDGGPDESPTTEKLRVNLLLSPQGGHKTPDVRGKGDKSDGANQVNYLLTTK